MNVLKSMFGTCSSSGEKSEAHEMIKRIFGTELVMKDNTDVQTQRSKYVTHVKDNLKKYLDGKMTTKSKGSKKQPVIPEVSETIDDRSGRIGPKIVVFDATSGTGRLLLVGDERVSVQGLSSFASIRATACVYSGKWMYEVQLGTKGIMQIGWCTASCIFSMDTGVGDTPHSYAYDGARVRCWNVVTTAYGQEWTSGDVIGTCINLDKGTLEFYRNGESMGIAFEKIPRGSGLAYFPAVSLALQEHVYANFGHVPFVFPVEGYSALQMPPTKDCARASLLFKSLNTLLDELLSTPTLKPPSIKNSKTKSVSSKNEEEIALNIHSAHSVQSSKPSAHTMTDTSKKMSRKAFIISLTRLVILELGNVLRLSYVVISDLLPRFKAYLGLNVPGINPDNSAKEFYFKSSETAYTNLAEKLLAQPQTRLCYFLDLLWTFLDEAALCDILEHCITRECLLFDLVSKDLKFNRQIEGLYTICGLMQHRETRHRLVKHVFFNKMTFDNFLMIKSPDEEVLKTFIRKPWWKKPTPVLSESDPKVIDEELSKRNQSVGTSTVTNSDLFDKDREMTDADLEKQYKEDCDKIYAAIVPLEQLQLEFLLLLLDNTDGTNMVPSTRKIFMEKFKRYILDNCILDIRLFNIARNTNATSWCCHARLLSALLKLWQENPLGNLEVPLHIPTNSVIDGELDYYNVDRLGGVLPFLVRTLRQDLINVLGADNAFIQSFEPNYNRSGGIDIGIDSSAASPGLATLPQVISSITRFMQSTMPLMPHRLIHVLGNPKATAFFSQQISLTIQRGNAASILGTMPHCNTLENIFLYKCIHRVFFRNTEETGFSLKGTQSLMPGSGAIDTKLAFLKLLDGLLALYHAGATKYAEKLCEIRDNQLDMADCLHEIQTRIATVTCQINKSSNDIIHFDIEKKQLMQNIIEELERSKKVYEEKLEKSAIQMAWIIGVLWTKKRQQELAKHFAGVLHSLRLASDGEYVTEVMVKELNTLLNNRTQSKEVLKEKNVIPENSYASLQLEYSSSSDQCSSTPMSGAVTTENNSQEIVLANPQAYASSLFAFVPEYHVDAMLELCNTLRLYMHPTVPAHQIPEWDELMVACASFLCGEFADSRIVLASTRESIVQTLASFATQPATMRAIERVPVKQQMSMIRELLRPYHNRAWAQSNWVLVRFWHGSGFGYHHRQWPHLASKYGDREPTVNNLGAKVDAGLMSQCFGPCPSEVIQGRLKDYLLTHPKEASAFINSMLNQINWAFSEFITMMQEMDRIANTPLESRQIKLCATCFDLYHGLARGLEMTLHLIPTILTDPKLCDNQNDLLLGRTCQILMAVISRTCIRASGGSGFARLIARGLPDMDRVHYYVSLAPVAGCLVNLLNPKLPLDHIGKVTRTLLTEPLFRIDGLEFMLGIGNQHVFSFYNYLDDITQEELHALELIIDRLRLAKDSATSQSPGSVTGQSDLLCTICYARPADTAFVPCGHQSCRACILQHLLQNNQCFFCKVEIESVKYIEEINS